MHQVTVKLITDLAGWLGAFCFLVSYFLLITKVWKSTSVIYHLFNILGGLLLTVNTLYDVSYPSAFINFTWALIAFYGLYSDYLKKR